MDVHQRTKEKFIITKIQNCFVFYNVFSAAAFHFPIKTISIKLCKNHKTMYSTPNKTTEQLCIIQINVLFLPKKWNCVLNKKKLQRIHLQCNDDNVTRTLISASVGGRIV